MKKIIITVLTVLFLTTCFTLSYAGSKYVVSGGHVFATTERGLDQALIYYNTGQYKRLLTLVELGMVTVFPPGVSVRIYTSGSYKVRVYVSGTGSTVWWTTKDALVHSSHRQLAK